MRHNNLVCDKCKYAVIFARISSARQEKGASIDAQLESIYNYCNKKGFQVIKEFTITESSSRGDRKQYKEMLEFIKQRKEKIAIVVNCVDRLQRSYKDTPVLDEMRANNKIEIHFLKESLIIHKNSHGSDILFWHMNVLMANSYILSLSDNVKRSLNYNRSLGKWQNKSPCGYLNVRDADGKANIIVDPDRAPIVKKMFEMYATGHESLDSVLEMTKELGLTTTKKQLKGHYITRNTVRSILTNSFYYGLMEIPDTLNPSQYIEIPHCYPPLITKELFDKVQECLQSKANHHGHPAKNGKIAFAFRGLIRCGECGSSISSEHHIKKKSGKEHIYLRCANKQKHCHQKLINEKVIFRQLKEELFDRLTIDPVIMSSIKTEVRQYLDDESGLRSQMKKTCLARLKELSKQDERLLNLCISGTVTEDVYQNKHATIIREKEELERRSEQYVILDNQMKDALESVMDLAGNFADILEKATVRQKNELLHLLLEDCVLYNGKLTYKIRKPFDILLFHPGDRSWLDINPDNLSQYNNLANEVKCLELIKK